MSLLKEEVFVLCLDSCINIIEEPRVDISQTQDLS